MLPQFCSFVLESGEVVRVNVSQVRCIKPVKERGSDEITKSRIEFDQNHVVIVDAKPEDVERALTTEDD